LGRLPERDIEQYWKKKEDEIGEKIRGRMLAEFISGYQNFSGPILGILFYTEKVLYFQTFPRENWFFSMWKTGESFRENKLLNFCIPWSNVKKIDFLPRKNPFFKLFLSQEYRILIDYQNNENRTNLTINMQSREDGGKLIEFYKKMQNTM